MLKEYLHVRQIEGESKRRWFNDQYFDLIVWVDENETIVGFQLCYDISHGHRALTWHKETGYTHHRIDDGDNLGRYKMTPILVADGVFDYNEIAAKFKHASTQLDKGISTFIFDKLFEYPHDQ